MAYADSHPPGIEDAPPPGSDEDRCPSRSIWRRVGRGERAVGGFGDDHGRSADRFGRNDPETSRRPPSGDPATRGGGNVLRGDQPDAGHTSWDGRVENPPGATEPEKTFKRI